jgi:hypothetical protein
MPTTTSLWDLNPHTRHSNSLPRNKNVHMNAGNEPSGSASSFSQVSLKRWSKLVELLHHALCSCFRLSSFHTVIHGVFLTIAFT